MPKRLGVTVKLIYCLLLCLSFVVVHGHMAAAQANAPAPAPATPPTAAPTAPAPPVVPAPSSAAPTVAAPPVAAPPAAAPPPASAAAAPVTAQTPAAAPAPVQNTVVTVSIMDMVRNSDPIVQAVMLFLVLCSAASWAAFIYKSISLAAAGRNTAKFRAAFGKCGATMDEAAQQLHSTGDGAARRMWLAAKQEWDISLRGSAAPLAADQINRLLQRLVLAMGSSEESALSGLGNWMGLLATIGSTAPFIGLFGTVWGILDSFEHISASFNTSLTVVAPGIAEALLATATGLFAAIPATMFYNRFAREIGKITGQLDNVTADIVLFASRDVERLGK